MAAEPEQQREAEVAFVVGDEHQGRGIGTVLLEHLAAAARERGITRFVAETLADNRRMLGVFRDAGFDEHTSASTAASCSVELPIEPTDRPGRRSRARAPGRGASMARLLTPGVGGGHRRQPRTRHTVGHQVLRNLLAGGFQGPSIR